MASWDDLGLGKGQGGQNGVGFSSATRCVTYLLWLVWPRSVWLKSSGVGRSTQPWVWGVAGRLWAWGLVIGGRIQVWGSAVSLVGLSPFLAGIFCASLVEVHCNWGSGTSLGKGRGGQNGGGQFCCYAGHSTFLDPVAWACLAKVFYVISNINDELEKDVDFI